MDEAPEPVTLTYLPRWLNRVLTQRLGPSRSAAAPTVWSREADTAEACGGSEGATLFPFALHAGQFCGRAHKLPPFSLDYSVACTTTLYVARVKTEKKGCGV